MTEYINEPARKLPVRSRTNVLVCGGGVAGAIAAIAAARQGAKVFMVERHGFAGGMNTASFVNGVGGWQYDLDGQPLIGGLPMELMLRVARLGGAKMDEVEPLTRPRPGGPDYRDGGLGCYWIQTHPEFVKFALDEMLAEVGVEVLYHSLATAAIVEGSRVRGAFVESKSGREAVLADVVIDCTGDGDIAVRAGAEFAMGRPGDGAVQPMTAIFVSAGSDVKPMSYRIGGDAPREDSMAANRYEGAVRLARQRGEIALNPNDVFCAATPLDVAHPGIRAVNFTRIQRRSAINAAELTEAEREGRRQCIEAVRFMRKYVQGAADATLMFTPAQIGIRESRRIIGDHLLTGEEILAGTDFPDAIARGIYLLDIHNPTEIGKPSTLRLLDHPYGIPYRCLLPRGLEGLLVAGRCISGDSTALASYRIQSHCMAMGEAAGVAAAIAAGNNLTPRQIDPQTLRHKLQKHGVNTGPNSRKQK